MKGRAYALILALRGPVLLLTLGLLFFFEQSGAIGFERTWPVLLIVFGVFKLAERAVAPPVPPPPPRAPYIPPQPGFRGPVR